MNKRELKKLEKLLVAERDRLINGIRQIEEDTLISAAGNGSTDIISYAEVGTDNFDRETALTLASTEAERLREVNEALARIEEGSFGVCESCGEEIPHKRLEVFPSAKYCVECKARIEREGVY